MLIWLRVLLIAIARKYFGCKPIVMEYPKTKVIKMSITESKRETVLKGIAKPNMPILYNSERLKSLMISIWLQVVDYPVILLLVFKNKRGGLGNEDGRGYPVRDWRFNFACPCSRN